MPFFQNLIGRSKTPMHTPTLADVNNIVRRFVTGNYPGAEYATVVINLGENIPSVVMPVEIQRGGEAASTIIVE